jgi:diketogulonate reductase-like aldo/keto reductase
MIGGDTSKSKYSNDDVDIKSIKLALSYGVYHIDTAEMYAAGHTEELVGESIRGYDRKKLFLASKVWNTNLKYADLSNSLQASLKRLGVEYLDLYMIHSPNDAVDIAETMKALSDLKEEGYIRNIGVSNFTVERLKKAQDVCRYPIVANQLHYNLVIREVEKKGLLEYCQKNDIMLVAWRPTQKGLLAKEQSPLMEEMCHKYNKTPSQIAINWLISQPNVVTICKMKEQQHIAENVAATGWNMTEQDVEVLRHHFPHQKLISDAVPLV